MKKDGMCDGVTPPSCATTTAPAKGKKIRPSKGRGKAGEEEEEGGHTPPNTSSEQENFGPNGETIEYDEKHHRGTSVTGSGRPLAGDYEPEESTGGGGGNTNDYEPSSARLE